MCVRERESERDVINNSNLTLAKSPRAKPDHLKLQNCQINRPSVSVSVLVHEKPRGKGK